MANQIIANTKQLDRLTLEFRGFEDQVGKAAYSALNRTIDFTITQVGRIVPKAYAIKAREVKASFKGGIKRPSRNDLTASILSRGHTLSIAHFPFSPKKLQPPGKKYKVKITIKRESGRQTINSSPKAFIGPTGAKSLDKTQLNIFKRVSKERLPIEVIRTLSIPQMITNEKISEKVLKAAEGKMDERLEHELIRVFTAAAKTIRR